MKRLAIASTLLLLSICACEKEASYTHALSRPVSLTNGKAASIALGAATVNGTGAGVTSSTGFERPLNVIFTTDNRLLISMHYRLGIYNTIPLASGAALDLVEGQTNFTNTVNSSTGPNTYYSEATGAFYDGTSLWVSDDINARVVSYSSFPSVNGTPPNFCIGAANLTSYNKGCSANQLGNPISVMVMGGKLFISDIFDNRVLIFNTVPSAALPSADIVVGQPNLTTCTGGATAGTLNAPATMWTDGVRLVIADAGNNRVLIWNSIPTTNGKSADVVLGQADFVSTGAGSGASGMNNPYGVASNGTQLFVADTNNNRVLVWNKFPTVNGQGADIVLGQSSFAGTAAGSSSTSLNSPMGLSASGSQLAVADYLNDRVLIFQ